MNTVVLEQMLVCPICRSALTMSDNARSLLCGGARRNCFDIAADGYVNFSGGGGGDPKAAVAARRRFLSLGHYRPVADAVLGLLDRYSPGRTVIDAGCGEGYYGDIIASGGYTVCGFDLSRHAVNAAAKRKNPNAFYAVAGIFSMPADDNCAAAVTNIFAPCAEAEFSRVMMPGGILVVAGAGSRHLLGLKQALYASPTLNTPRADLPREMKLLDCVRVTGKMTLDSRESISDLFAMTPYYYRTNRDDAGRLSALDRLETETDIEITVYKKEAV